MHLKLLIFLCLATFVFLVIYSNLIYNDSLSINSKIILRSDSNCECKQVKKIYLTRQNNSFQIFLEKDETQQIKSIETYDIPNLNEIFLWYFSNIWNFFKILLPLDSRKF